jgi:hypothetical protein
MSRKRSISALLNESLGKKSKTKITCNCDECNGILVDTRTEFSHRYRKSKKKVMTKQEFTFRPRTRNIRQNQFMSLGNGQDIFDDDTFNADIFDDDTFNADIFNDDISEDNNETFDKLNNLFEDYSAPDFSDSGPSKLDESIDTDCRFIWILLWIMNFRIKFNLSDTAIEALLKFMKLVLIKIGGNEFESFSGSLHIAKKFLGLSDQFVSFVVCQKCHKLYKREEVIHF